MSDRRLHPVTATAVLRWRGPRVLFLELEHQLGGGADRGAVCTIAVGSECVRELSVAYRALERARRSSPPLRSVILWPT
jgi:hypothetical protein